ncbi:hypothetical protein JB92DRAFT_2828019 [Gautieria morchelliformis]|nr:hypothetical protein JB92DRAFT_2828019 [Gautieria morchelliformis]
MVDGLRKSVIESDTVPLPNAPTGSVDNWAGNTLIMQERTLRMMLEAPEMMTLPKIDVGVFSKPVWAMSWDTKVPPPRCLRHQGRGSSDMPGCGPQDDVPQTMDPPNDSVEKWANEEESIDDDDILLFVTMGVNHIPRPEDWPVVIESQPFVAILVNRFHLEIGVPDYKLWNLKAG